jgi:IclR family transcriptional regulator, KDG regulon repressor
MVQIKKKLNNHNSHSTNDTDSQSIRVESVERAMKILDCIGKGINNLTDIATHTSLSNSTTHRLLHTLAESKAVVFDPINHHYFLGYLLVKLTSDSRITHQHLILRSLEEMRKLGEYTQETVSLLILEGLRHYRLCTVPSHQWLRIVDPNEEDRNIGDMYFRAPGKVLLSQLSDEIFKKTFKYIKSSTRDPQLTFDKLKELIEPVAKQGYAVSSGERIRGGTCICIPVKNYPFPLSLNLYGPSIRMKPRLKVFIDNARQCAARISALNQINL